jgi:hypothetical protein
VKLRRRQLVELRRLLKQPNGWFRLTWLRQKARAPISIAPVKAKQRFVEQLGLLNSAEQPSSPQTAPSHGSWDHPFC